MPTEEERSQIQEARANNPDVPLGPAEEFLYTLSSIPELHARLSLWRFNFVFHSVEEVRMYVHAHVCTCAVIAEGYRGSQRKWHLLEQ